MNNTRWVIFFMILLAIASWLSLAYFTYAYAPTPLAKFIFLGLLLPAAFTSLTPLAYYLHTHLSGAAARRMQLGDAMREAVLLSGLLVAWAGLRMIEALNWTSVLIMSGAALLIEALILLRRK